MSRKIDIDTMTFVRFWLVILGFLAVGFFVSQAFHGLVILMIAIFLAIALRPLANMIDRMDGKEQGAALPSILAVVAVVSSIVLIIGLVGPVVINETVRFLNQAPGGLEQAVNNSGIQQIGQAFGIHNLGEQIVDSLNNFSSELVNNLSKFALTNVNTVGQILTSTVLVVVLTILIMLEGPELMELLWKNMGKRKESTRVVRKIVSKMADVITKYVSRQLLIAGLDGVATTFFVLVLSVIFSFSSGLAIPMGLMAMILYMIPMFGPIITCIVVSVILFFNLPLAGLVFLVVYAIYSQVENSVLAPKIHGKGLSMSPLLIMIAIVVGMYAFGLVGTIVAVPIAGCIKVLLEEYPKIRELSE